MAVRTTPGKVREILGANYDTRRNLPLDPFIESASSLVDWVESKDDTDLMSASALELVERWLAAHFYHHADQLYQNRSNGGASGTFQGQTGMILKSSLYGQTAMVLDLTGMLAMKSDEAEQGGPKRAQLIWLGTEAE